MDLDREGLAVVVYTERGILRGKVTFIDTGEVQDAVQSYRPGPPLLHLSDASLLDFEFNVLHRVREMAINKNAILFVYEDEQAADITRLKNMIANEDFESAAAEVDRLLLTSQRDAELFYLAGLIYERFEGERARECFQKALSLIRDDKFRAVVAHHLG